ncbi:MAG: MDR family oxidoreductase [Bacteroidota bacterium]
MRALVLHKTDSGIDPQLEDLDLSRLPQGDVLIDVSHSSLNYKDGLAVTGKGKIVRGEFPFVPGIDLAGTVAESASDAWAVGDAVVLTGWGTGEERWGGFAERARAHADHLVRLPDGLSPASAMAIGTAGFTAMLSVMALEHAGITEGDIAVTGASGGVGSTAVALLAHAGYTVHAFTGTPSAHEGLRQLGAADVHDRSELADPPKGPMGRGRWAGAVDSVGGTTLTTLIATTERRGCVAACGLAGGHALHTTVFPFILRGVTLAGIDSNTSPQDERQNAWNRLANAHASGGLDAIPQTTIGLAEVPEWSETIVAGQTVGRVIVDVRS